MGVLQLLICSTQTGNEQQLKVVLIRRLRRVQPHVNNKKVTDIFNHARYGYELSTVGMHDILIEYVLVNDIQRPLTIVPDFHNLKIRHSRNMSVNEVPDDFHERQHSRYFCLNGYQETALPEFTI